MIITDGIRDKKRTSRIKGGIIMIVVRTTEHKIKNIVKKRKKRIRKNEKIMRKQDEEEKKRNNHTRKRETIVRTE